MLKAADVNHAARPLAAHLYWSECISTEFFRQGDAERARGLPVTAVCDRAKAGPRGQMGFIQFVVRPCFEPLGTMMGDDRFVQHCQRNFEHWEAVRAVSAYVPLKPLLSCLSIQLAE
jgi:hypothetical protein